MKKIYFFIISFAVTGALFSFSSFNSASIMVGQKISAFDLPAVDKEELIWINFWAVYDAASRNENAQFSYVIKKMEEKSSEKALSLKSVSISMDKFDSVFEEALKQDNLSFFQVIREPEGFKSKIAKELKLNNRFGNFLFDAQGRLVAKNLTPEELELVISD